MSEKNIQALIQMAATQNGVTVWRNNTGVLPTPDGGMLRYGLCRGSSDLIGIRPTVITQAHVGKTVGIFTALEVKTPSGKATPEQINFINAISRLGGIAGIVRSPDDAVALLNPLEEL